MKKLFVFCIICIVVLSGIAGIATGLQQQQINSSAAHAMKDPYIDELDQSMTEYEGSLPAGNTNIFGLPVNLSIAQSFIPQKELLTRAKFFMARSVTTTHPCFLAVRENLTGENLALIAVQPTKFPIVEETPTEEQLEWIEFDFDDIWITIGQTYYLVIYTANITNNYYWVSGNGTNLYLNGTVFLSLDNGQTWEEFSDADGCFQTYGLRETFLSIESFGGWFGQSFRIKNIGDYTAWDVTATLTVKGGIFNNINQTTSVTTPELPAGDAAELRLMNNLFGLGPMIITIRVSAANVREEISLEINGFILLFFIILR